MQNSDLANDVRLLFVIPGPKEGNSFIFSKREFAYISQILPNVRQYFFDTKLSFSSLWRQWRELRKIVRDERINVIHAQYGTITGFICLLSRQEAKLVTTFRGSDLGWSSSVSFARNLFSKMLSYIVLFFADQVILVSRSLCRNHKVYNLNSVVLPTGINGEIFFPMNSTEAKRQLGWSTENYHLLFNCGKDPVRKRLDLAEAAFERLKAKYSNVELHVMKGDVPFEQVPVWMNAADLLLMLSDLEGSPTVVQEALACGTGVLAVPVGDTVERLSDRVDSILVRQNVDDIAAGILAMIERRIVKDIHRKEDFEFDYKKVCKSIVDIYKKSIMVRRS